MNTTTWCSVCIFRQFYEKGEKRVFKEQPGRISETKTGEVRQTATLCPPQARQGVAEHVCVFHPHPFDLLPSRYRSSRGGINGRVCVGRNAGRRPKLQIASLATAASTRHGRGLLNLILACMKNLPNVSPVPVDVDYCVKPLYDATAMHGAPRRGCCCCCTERWWWEWGDALEVARSRPGIEAVWVAWCSLHRILCLKAEMRKRDEKKKN